MAGLAYLDSSAVLKLAVREDETSALEADVARREGLITSRLAVLECRRAVRRAGSRRVRQALEEVFEALYLLDVTTAILERAAELDPPALRSLDAIHLATALSLEYPDLDVITYDRRLAEAALANRLRVLHPGS